MTWTKSGDLTTSFISFDDDLNFTTTTTKTTIKTTPTGIEIPRINGKLTVYVEVVGLNPFATNALEVTPNPAILAEANLLTLFITDAPFPFESIWPAVTIDPVVISEKDISEGSDIYGSPKSPAKLSLIYSIIV